MANSKVLKMLFEFCTKLKIQQNSFILLKQE
jgi:hypothetical protein